MRGLRGTLAVLMLSAAAASAQVALADPATDALMATIVPSAPGVGFYPEADPNSLLASGPIDMASVTDGYSDPLSGISLTTEAVGVKRYWINKREARLMGVQAFALGKKKASTFMTDWQNSAKAAKGQPTDVPTITGAKQASLAVGGQSVHQVAFTVNDTGYIVMATRTTPNETLAYAAIQATYATGGGIPKSPAHSTTPKQANVPAPAGGGESAVVSGGSAVTSGPTPSIAAVTPTIAGNTASPRVVIAQPTSVASERRLPGFVKAWMTFGALGFLVMAVSEVLKRLGVTLPIPALGGITARPAVQPARVSAVAPQRQRHPKPARSTTKRRPSGDGSSLPFG